MPNAKLYALSEFISDVLEVTKDNKTVKGSQEYSREDLLKRTYSYLETGKSDYMTGSAGLRDKLKKITHFDVPQLFGYTYKEFGCWKSCRPRRDLPNEGIKLHISLPEKNIKNTDNFLTAYCVAKKLDFKHIKSEEAWKKLNTSQKNLPYTQGGKGFTIYMKTEDEALEFVEALAPILDYMERKTGKFAPIVCEVPFKKSDKISASYRNFNGERLYLNDVSYSDDALRNYTEDQIKIIKARAPRLYQALNIME